MARISMGGFEAGFMGTSAAANPDKVFGSGASVQQAVVRSGLWAAMLDSGAGAGATFTQSGGTFAANVTLFYRDYYCFRDLPDFQVAIFACGGSGGVTVELTATGNLCLRANGVQIGSLSVATIVADSATWYRVEIKLVTDASGNIASAELQLNGVSVASGSFTAVGTSPPSVGWFTSPGASKVMYVDDHAINDATGTDQDSWPGDEKIVLLLPVSLNANGGSWVDDKNQSTSAALAAAIDNAPPNGIADTTSNATGGHQIRNGAANTSVDFNLTDYATAGIGASDTINVVMPAVAVAAPVSTGAKSGSFGILSNPVIAQRAFRGGAGTATFFWRGTAAGTYPTGWGWEVGTVMHSPTVTLATAPVARLSITGGTTSRVAMCCDMGMYVGYTPAVVAPPASLVVDTRRGSRNNPLLRRMQQLPWSRRPSGILVPDRRILLPQPVI